MAAAKEVRLSARKLALAFIIMLAVAFAALNGAQPAFAADGAATVEQTGNDHIKHVILNIGADETQRNVNWLTDVNDDAEYQNVVEYAPAPKGWKEGDAFPAKAEQVKADSAATRFQGTLYSNKATLEDLKPNTTYLYRVGDPGVEGKEDEYPAIWSKTYSFTTGAGKGDFNFILAGDPQIGAGSTDTDIQGWVKTLNQATSAFKPDFLFSVGDQINNYDGDSAEGIKELEAEYDGFFAPSQIQSLTTATEVGNHDEGNGRPGNSRYTDSYNLPNRSGYGLSDGAGEQGADYWFTYNGVLFMSLNSNNTSTAEHKTFMQQAIKENPGATWKIVSFHHSTYSTANHYTDDDIIQRRKELSPVFSELQIDAVLMGHDHHYTRTYLMDGQNPIIPAGQDVTKGQKAPSEQTAKPGQVFYLTANSASGSKYYKLNKELAQGKPAWAAKDDQADRPSITDVKVTANAITFTSYYTDKAKPEQFDTFTLKKDTKAKGSAAVSHVALNIGADQTQRNFNWLSTSEEDGELQIVKKPAAYKEGDAFPEKGATTVKASTRDTEFSFARTTNEATATNLAPSTEYVYRVGNAEGWSKPYVFKTGAGTGAFSFIAAGDPQIGTGSIPTDTQGWKQTMDLATKSFAPEFLFNMGDQINNYDGDSADGATTLEGEYDGFMAPSQMQTLTFATEVGNHDEGNHEAGNSRYGDTFDMPNRSFLGRTAGTGDEGADYYFVYDNVLFMSLNSNNTSTAEHKAFMQDVIAKYPNVKWKFVSFHHAIFSTANHYTDTDIQKRRQELAPVFSDLGIDVVLMGHDHHYTRTYLMDGQNPIVPKGQDVTKGQKAPSEQTAEAGQVLYLTLNSASGSKYYKLNSELQQGKPAWAAVDDQQDRPSITDIKVTDDAITFTSYYTGSKNEKKGTAAGAISKPEQFDTFTLKKAAKKPAEANFADVKGEQSWVKNEGWLDYAVQHGLMSGYKDPVSGLATDQFGPADKITRGQVATVLYRIANPDSDATTNPANYGKETGFSDQGEFPYYRAAVKWLKDKGVSTGDKDPVTQKALNTFRPDDPITREELATLVYRFAQVQGVKVEKADIAELKKFKDGSEVLPFAQEAMAWSYKQGVITGGKGADEGKLMPLDNAQRSQAAKIFSVLHRDVLKLK